MSIPKRVLGNTGFEVSVIGYGCSPLGFIYNSSLDEEEAIRSVREAFNLGVNFFDTSPYYGFGHSEKILGKALKDLPRSDIILATKVGRYHYEEFDFSTDNIIKSVNTSLERLQTDYIDLVQCHDIEFVVDETLPALQKLKESGKVKRIGITGYPLKIYTTVLDQVPPGTVDTILSYCHNTLFDDSLIGLIPYLKSKGVGIINASPLSMALLSPKGPPEWHPASEAIKQACLSANELCKERNVSLPKIAIFHALQNEDISTTLVGMPSIAEVHQNVETAKLKELTPEETACLKEVLKILEPVHNQTWPSGLPENN